MRWLSSLLGSKSHSRLFASGQPQPAQDTLAAIDELTRAIKHNPGAVEICSALGNLYRLRGELDRAIQIRTGLIARPHLRPHDKARVYFELGRDYSRAGLLDRAQEALGKAKELGSRDQSMDRELAELFAKSGEYLAASRLYRSIGAIPQAAHYLVREACPGSGVINRGLLDEALEMYPPSPEGWLETISLLVRTAQWDELLRRLKHGLHNIDPALGFLLLDPLQESEDSGAPSLPEGWLDELIRVVLDQPQNLAIVYSTGCLLRTRAARKKPKPGRKKPFCSVRPSGPPGWNC